MPCKNKRKNKSTIKDKNKLSREKDRSKSNKGNKLKRRKKLSREKNKKEDLFVRIMKSKCKPISMIF